MFLKTKTISKATIILLFFALSGAFFVLMRECVPMYGIPIEFHVPVSILTTGALLTWLAYSQDKYKWLSTFQYTLAVIACLFFGQVWPIAFSGLILAFAFAFFGKITRKE